MNKQYNQNQKIGKKTLAISVMFVLALAFAVVGIGTTSLVEIGNASAAKPDKKDCPPNSTYPIPGCNGTPDFGDDIY